MSLNDSLFGEEDKRWEAYWDALQEQKQKDHDDDKLYNTKDIPHSMDQSSDPRA